MEANSTLSPDGETDDTEGTSFTSPVFILPVVVSLATLVAVIIAACVIYRKRQRRRAQELARQLRVTERRIDAIGSLKARKEQELAARKVEYIPPNHLPFASNSSLEDLQPSLRNGPHQFMLHTAHAHNSKEGGYSSQSTTEVGNIQQGRNEVTCHCSVHSNPAVGYSSGDTYSSSYRCSTCKGSSVNNTTTRQEAINSSLAVECGTIPSASSASTVQTAVKVKHSQWSHSESHSIVTGTTVHSAHNKPHTSNTSHSASNIGTWGSTSVTSSGHLSALPPPPVSPHTGTAPLWYDIALSQDGEEEGRPNTPATTTTDETSVVHTDGGVSDGQKEKWV